MTFSDPGPRRRRRGPRILAAVGALTLTASLTSAVASAQTDPRIGLGAGYLDAEQAASNVSLLASLPRQGGFDGPPGNFSFVNSDLAFTDDLAILGSFAGFQVYDISDPAEPFLRSSFVCAGGQGDVSVYGDLLFMSVEETRGRIDCGTQGTTGTVDPERFRGVRIFDISDVDNPVQLPGVQTCRGSHTHTLVTDPEVDDTVWIYNSGTAGVRSPDELPGCQNAALTDQPVTSGDPTQWRIDVIEVPLDAPEAASIVSQPRIFTDPATGAYNGLQNTLSGALHPSGTPYSPMPNTNTCHDITVFPEIGLAAGACQGNGILLDISDPADPQRLDAVSDPNFSYWHSATFNNDGTKVVFTDEWGGGTGARCRDTDRPEWGANALFDVVDGRLQFRSYYKLPVPQTVTENCVAHNGSIVPVPGRDIMVQAWYQGGMSVFDFTDTANPTEIAFFDRGPVSATQLLLAGYWSTYWYNGNVLGSEIARGFDSLALEANPDLTANEIEAASEVRQDEFNAQLQTRLVNEPSFAVTRARVDQSERAGTLGAPALQRVRQQIDQAQRLLERPAGVRAALAQLAIAERTARQSGDTALADAIAALADSLG